MDEMITTVSASLPGWFWEDWDDGSGCIVAPSGQRYYHYDLSPYANWDGIEYAFMVDWKVFWGCLAEFKVFAEEALRAEYGL